MGKSTATGINKLKSAYSPLTGMHLEDGSRSRYPRGLRWHGRRCTTGRASSLRTSGPPMSPRTSPRWPPLGGALSQTLWWWWEGEINTSWAGRKVRGNGETGFCGDSSDEEVPKKHFGSRHLKCLKMVRNFRRNEWICDQTVAESLGIDPDPLDRPQLAQFLLHVQPEVLL